MSKGNGVSSYTHIHGQLNHYANQHNPNNKAYVANNNNHSNQMNGNSVVHQQMLNNRANQLNPNNPNYKGGERR